ncbi:MAG: endonuclease [Bacteroidetes bacterium]|nr:endonuclease [Bacteroidota bacterium]
MIHKANVSVGLLLAALFCFPAMMMAQGLTVSATQLNFGVAYENAPDSLQLTISNPTSKDITVTHVRFYDTYNVPAFSVADDYMFIPAGNSFTTWVKFSPRHNILHNTEMILENNSLRGYVSVDLIGQGRYSNSYYSQTENQSEEALKSAIHTVTTSGYISLGYNIARDTMFMIVDNQRYNGQGASQNTLECIYTGRLAVGYVDRSDCQTNDNFNTEHTFPQSLFSSAEPMKSDLHHLFPTDDGANSIRGDNPFAEVNSPTWTSGGSSATNTHFEPRDAQKGQTARALLYFILRYQNYSNFVDAAQQTVLLNWHDAFPPLTVEKNRNSAIQRTQHNRNPFVDYPQFVERIHSFINTSTAPVDFSYDLTQDTIIFGYVLPNTPADFNYVIENKGNTVIDISNIQITHPTELSIVSGGSNTSIQPGEAHNVGIHFLSTNTDSGRAFLSFHLAQSGGAGQANATIPVFVNDDQFNSVQQIISKTFSVYPNPVDSRLYVDAIDGSLPADYQLISSDGKVVMTHHGNIAEDFSLDVSELPAGIYLLKSVSSTSVSVSAVSVY